MYPLFFERRNTVRSRDFLDVIIVVALVNKIVKLLGFK
nr:MAG TPA: hypothetical protein [Caudoviricetes sp.]